MLEYKPREVVISGFQIKVDRLHHDCFLMLCLMNWHNLRYKEY